MTRMGEDAYYIRKSIDHFLCDFPNRVNAHPSYNLAPSALKFNQNNCLF